MEKNSQFPIDVFPVHVAGALQNYHLAHKMAHESSNSLCKNRLEQVYLGIETFVNMDHSVLCLQATQEP